MRASRRRWLLVVAVTLSISAALGQTATGRVGPRRGLIVETYRTSSRHTAPNWARTAITRARAQLPMRPGALSVLGADRDDLDMRHVRFAQRHDGVPVFGSQLIAHLGGNQRPWSRTGRVYRGIDVNSRPSITAAQAIAAARRTLGYTGSFASPPTARLVVLPLDSRYVLAYQVALKIEDGTQATAHHQYFVGAHTGKIAWQYNSLPTRDAVGSGASLYSGAVRIHADLVGGNYQLRDLTRGILTNDMGNGVGSLGDPFVDDDNQWGGGAGEAHQRAGVDAHFGAAQTWDYFLKVHRRRGIDGAGFQMLSRVHYGRNYNNAFWNGSYMTYGDGDGRTFSPLVALDIAGHEITHGVTELTANLVYEGQSGAANESFSDIFGTAVEFYSARPNRKQADYLIGEDVFMPADARPGFRNLANPREDGDPDHYSNRRFAGKCLPSPSNDNCGVHINSGIQNNAFYLLAEGGRNRTSRRIVRGIGRRAAERIFFRALTVYLTPRSNFHDVRAACLRAANDLFPGPPGDRKSARWRATADAWGAVGVD